MFTVMLVVLIAAAMILIERLRPGVEQPRVRGWITRLILLNAVQVGAVFLGAHTWDRWFPGHGLLPGHRLPGWAGVLLGYVGITFVFYWWHRARHEVPLLWRWLHQIHHSPVRVECAMSFYKHPVEILINGLICSALLHLVLGLAPAVAAIVVAITGVAELVYHWNVRTPYWMGFFFQRPEMHRVHHARDWHRSNYSDLPLWDLLFGTLENPRIAPRDCGFADQRERQLVRMLLGKDPT